MHTFYHAVARHFDIPRADYVDLLPEIPEPSAAAIPLQPPYASPKNAANAQDVLPLAAYQEPQEQIPDEYRHDPDLWRALKASLAEGGEEPGQQPNNADLYHVRVGANTGSTADDREMFNDAGGSFETEKLHHGDDKIHEFGAGQDGPMIEQSALNQQRNQNRAPQKTKTEHAKELRERKAAEYEKKRILAKEKMQQSHPKPQMQKGWSQVRGRQLGQPLRQFVDIQNNMGKLRSNIDLILSGQMRLAELEDLPGESEVLLQGDRSEKSPMKQQKGNLPIYNN